MTTDKKSMFNISRKIMLPKNRIRLFTTDKSGKETGKVRETTNLWTSYGYKNFWYAPDVNPYPYIAFSNGSLGGVYSGLGVKVSNGTTEITLESTNLSGTTIFSNTRVISHEGITYHRFDEVTISGKDYYKLTFLFSYPHGNLNMSVGQVGMSLHAGASLVCGTRLNDENGDPNPIIVTEDEQLNVMYSIFIPKDMVMYDVNEIQYWQETNYLINGETETMVRFNRRPIRVFISSPTDYTFYFVFTPVSNQAHTLRAYNQGAVLGNTGTYPRNYTFSNSNKKIETTIDAVFTPTSISGNAEIDRMVIIRNNGDVGWFDIHFDPPITKGPDDRLNISFKYTVEIDEEDF